MADQPFHSGFIAIIGRPNAGKSTLLNRILGEKIVITSDKPQTTRNRVQGIHNLPGFQIIFIDTPGIHTAKSQLNRYMVNEALASLKEVDGVVFLVDAAASQEEQEKLAAEVLGPSSPPVILALNKIDLVEQVRATRLLERFTSLHPFRDVIALSATTGDGVESLVSLVSDLLPEGPEYFPDDILTDLPERFIAAEIIREKVFRLTHEEIPYSVAVTVESFKERENGVIAIGAVVTVERDSQKGIIIGRKGEMLKKIGTEARKEIEDLLQTKVFLELFVRVRKNWTDNPNMLKEFGYQ
jgi:GTP-binding protein Era